MKFYKPLFVLIILGISILGCRVIQLEPIKILTFEQKLEALFPDAEITKIEVKDHFKKSFQLVLNQPLDHNNLDAGTFKHYIYLSHSDFSKPTVLITEGYNANPKTYELSKIFKGNQIQVEYRFYGKSRPNPIPWEYLKNDQAIEDYHQIVTKLKSLYTSKWISTGISKGGETVLIYKSKYPYDIDVAVPYVAPIINSQEDSRIKEHLKTVGNENCRMKIKSFQRSVLEKRDSILVELNKYSSDKRISFTEFTMEEVLEYSVLEMPFSFWQWNGNCESIPSKYANAYDLFEYLNGVVGFSFYSDKTYQDLLPSYYQHMTELGYYGFDITPVEDLIKVVKKPSNLRFAPKNVDLTFNPNYMNNVRDYVENKGNKILYIYGDYDTWFAFSPQLKPHVNALKMVLKGGTHSTRIRHFSNKDKQRIYDKLQNWLGYSVTIYPLENK